MKRIKPCNEDSYRMLRQLSKNGRACTHDMTFVKQVSTRKKIRDVTTNNFLDIAHNRRKGKTWFILPPNIELKSMERGKFFKFQKKS